MFTLAAIIEQWMRRHAAGEIKFDPRLVESRWVLAPGHPVASFKLVLNLGRAARLVPKAA